MFLYILIIIVAALLALVVLAQNPKGGGLAAGFTGASQIGGVQRTADFLEKSTAAKLEGQSTALFNTASLFDDGIIDPRDTRKLLVFLLHTIREAAQRDLKSNTYGVARF